MRFDGLLDALRSGLAALLRAMGQPVVWLGNLVALLADLADPAMPETIRRPREWMPRLWDRTGGRTPFEDRT